MSAHRYEIKDVGADVLIDGADISMRCNSAVRNALRQQLADIKTLSAALLSMLDVGIDLGLDDSHQIAMGSARSALASIGAFGDRHD